MKILALLFVGVVMIVLPANGQDEHFVQYGPNGEVADESTPYLLFPDDNGDNQVAYLVKPQNESFAPIPTEKLKDVVRFFLYTRNTPNKETGEQIFVEDHENLLGTTFNPEFPVKILIHGFTNTIASPTIQEPKEAYLRSGDFNVIGVDWGDNCRFPWYWSAVENTIYVGNYVGEMVNYLSKIVRPEHIHIIGHSLGAHVSGNAGHAVGGMIARVTGLDPAGPWFHDKPLEEKIDPSDAHYVDVIHTCAGAEPNLGMMETAGMADFYPNGGTNVQPGCTNFLSKWLPEVIADKTTITCSHSKAHKLWTESILHPDQFPAVSCDSLEDAVGEHCSRQTNFVMGEHSDLGMQGIYWLKTQ